MSKIKKTVSDARPTLEDKPVEGENLLFPEEIEPTVTVVPKKKKKTVKKKKAKKDA